MALYLIGDVQGCDAALQHLLDTLAFSPSRDTLYLLGDLVNRGPDSLATLRRLQALGDAARCVLGNHDLHLLATAAGARRPSRKDTLQALLAAADAPALLAWLRQQRMARLIEHARQRTLLVHAGVLPQWDAAQTLALAAEVEAVLRDPAALHTFLHAMYGNAPDGWHDALQGLDRLRVIVNALTRLRFCSTSGRMEFDSKEGAHSAPPGYLPWFDVPGRRSAALCVAFGHWSTLGWLNRPDVLALDSGCVWGGALTAYRLAASPGQAGERISVPCPQAQKPGASG